MYLYIYYWMFYEKYRYNSLLFMLYLEYAISMTHFRFPWFKLKNNNVLRVRYGKAVEMDIGYSWFGLLVKSSVLFVTLRAKTSHEVQFHLYSIVIITSHIHWFVQHNCNYDTLGLNRVLSCSWFCFVQVYSCS